MSQNPTIDSDHKSSSHSKLKPQLAIALSSLEVQLDQELTRYRRTRSLIKPPKQVNSDSANSLKDSPGDIASSLSPQHQPESIYQENQALELELTEETSNLPGSVADDTILPSNIPTSTPDTSNSVSSIVPMKVQTEEDKNLVPTSTTTHPDDYLESSEALLRSLQPEQAKPKQLQKNQNDSLLSPLGIGSMLLLLLASLTLGYVVFNPQTMPQWDMSKVKLFNFNWSFLSNENKAKINNTESSSTPEPEITPIAKYPNLAASEFPEVKDPNDVVGLRPKPKPTPTPTPELTPPVAIATPKTTITPIPLPGITPKTTTPETNTVIKPSTDGYYYLIADNQGNDTLAAVQKVVPDAYLSDGKKYIYLGALKTEEETKKRLQELKKQGVNARVRQP